MLSGLYLLPWEIATIIRETSLNVLAIFSCLKLIVFHYAFMPAVAMTGGIVFSSCTSNPSAHPVVNAIY